MNQNWVLEGKEPVLEQDTDPLDFEIEKLYAALTDDNKKYLYGYIQRLLEEQGKSREH